MTRTEKGASTLSDEVQAKARVAAAEATVIDISGELTRWKSRLSNSIGAEKLPALGGEMPAWMNKACDDRDPDWFSISTVIKAEAMKDEAVSQLELSKRKKYPTINLEGQVNHDILDRGNSGNQMDYKLGLNVDTSLFDGGLAKTNDKVAQAALVGASAASRARRVEAANTISQARMQNASLQTSIANKVARGDLMRQTRDLYQEQYLELGTRTLLDLLNSVQELHSVNFDIVNARFDIRKHNLMCAISSGKIRKYLSLDGTTIRGVRL